MAGVQSGMVVWRSVDTMSSVRPDGYAQVVRMLSRADLRADIARLPATMAVQVIFGDAAVVTPPEANRSAASARPRTPISVIARGGHAVYLEKPAESNELLLRFIGARRRAVGTGA